MAGGDGNLLAAVPQLLETEETTALVAGENLRIERIVSTGHASPPGFWYDQAWAEWVLLVSGSAGVLFEGEAEPRVLWPGDYLLIPAHQRHRIAWTDVDHSTVWLAVHFRDTSPRA